MENGEVMIEGGEVKEEDIPTRVDGGEGTIPKGG